jgi:hypothetical protein
VEGESDEMGWDGVVEINVLYFCGRYSLCAIHCTLFHYALYDFPSLCSVG